MRTILLIFAVVATLAGLACAWAWLICLGRGAERLAARPAAVVAVVLFVLAAMATTAALAHDPYTDWKIPGTTTSCCNQNDCRPVRARVAFDGIWEVWHEGRWLPVPAGAMLPFPSPDGRSHACIIGSAVLCMLPGEIRG